LIVSSLSNFLAIERVILKKSGEIEDEGTNSIMGNFRVVQKKNHLDAEILATRIKHL